MSINPNPDRTLRAVLTVTVETRPDGTYYVDQADLTRHVSGWLEEALYDRDDIEQVKVGERDAELLRAQAEAHQYRTALQGVARKAAVSVVPPATNQTALREQVAAAIWERQNPGRRYADCEYRWKADAEADADAVLGVLPAPVDRADVLRWAAEGLLRLRDSLITEPDVTGKYLAGIERSAAELRRLAAEAPHTETPDEPAVVAQPGKDPS